MKFRDLAGREILVAQAGLDIGMFGDGSDGAVTFDGTTTVLGLVPSSMIYTLNRSIFCGTITINARLSKPGSRNNRAPPPVNYRRVFPLQ